jgi:hypothetical protein
MKETDMAVRAHARSNLEIEQSHPSPARQEGSSITGRGGFVVQSVNGGVAVRAAMFIEGDRMLDMPALFPDVHYAIAQIDELKNLVAHHFAKAAQFGTQMIAAQAQAQMNVAPAPPVKNESLQVDARSTAVRS